MMVFRVFLWYNIQNTDGSGYLLLSEKQIAIYGRIETTSAVFYSPIGDRARRNGEGYGEGII